MATLNAKQIYAAMQAEWVKLTGVKKGDTVRITREFTENEQGFSYWTSRTNSTVGQTFVIGEVNKDYIANSGMTIGYPYYILEVVTVPKEVKLTEGNVRTVNTDGKTIDCGCVHLTVANAKKAIKLFEDLDKVLSASTVNSISFSITVEGTVITRANIASLKKLAGE